GVFKSWAVTRGPSLDPADKRLAVEVEDHPLDYGDFEGTIPKGEYGGGTVQLWDRGYWMPEDGTNPASALHAGELKFRMEGERLHGGWVLVRMRHDRQGGKRTNWLLIKHRDEFARSGDHDALLADDRSVASGRPMAAIEAGKGRAPRPFMLAAGRGGRIARADAVWHSNRQSDEQSDSAGASADPTPTIRKTKRTVATGSGRNTPAPAAGKRLRGQLPAFIAPQLAKLVDRPPAEGRWGHEVKLDGYRLQLRVQKGRATLKTRKGLDWTRKFEALAEAASDLPDCIIDGEVVALNERGVPDFAALQAALADEDSDNLVFFAFDLLCEGQEDLRSLALTDRKARLAALLEPLTGAAGRRIRYLEHLESDGDAVLRSACRIDMEGIVSKRLDDPYRSDRSGSWVKSKCRAGHEVVIGGWSSESGVLRSLLVGVYRDGELVPVGRVGTGFGRAKVTTLMKRLKPLAVAASPFAGKVPTPGGRKINWVKPELVAEIEFAGWTDGGNVRQAAFKGLRDDKPAREVRAETPVMLPVDETPVEQVSQGKAPVAERAKRALRVAAGGRASSRATAGNGKDSVLGVNISKPDKVLWPDAADGKPVTKLDLAEYYAAIGEWMLPHLQGRPCSIVRAPDGIEGQRFFQRHAMAGMSKLVDLINIAGDRQPYVAINRLEGLIAIAQTAGLELHPGGCVPDEPEVPGRLVFDLDPAPDVEFAAVITAALELRSRLEKIGLPSFCKTTGGKGLHVVCPLAPSRKVTPDWNVAKAFAREVCRQMTEDAPERFVLNMAKKERTGRIFLDYLRNDRLSTAVAPLSTRARPGATVSMPLNWQQVKAGLDPMRYTVRTVPQQLQRNQPWEDYEASAGSLVAAIGKLTGNTAPESRRSPASA
ncbi:MAG: DNA ligase D, partial [Sinobacteraceae bacterium]|nr:DNA ligase D [Nevskiaceae bacterium]